MGISGDVLSLGIDVQANPEAAAQIDKVTAALAQFRAESTALGGGANSVGAQINVAIGAFTQLGQTIDTTNARAVAGFAAIGENLTAQLARLGATDAELNRIGATITRVQQAAGAANLQNLIPTGLTSGLAGTAFATRRGADAISSLAFAAQAGTTSMQGLSIGAGSVATSFLALGGAGLGAATVFGALVTIGLTLVGVLSDTEKKSKDAKKALDELKQLSVPSIGARIEDVDAQIKQLEATRATIAKQPGIASAITGAAAPGLGGILPDFASSALVLRNLDKQISELAKHRADLREAETAAQAKNLKEISGEEARDIQETAVARIAADQGEFAARRRQLDFELQNRLTTIRDSGAAEAIQRTASAAAQARFDADRHKLEVDEAAKLAEAKAAADAKAIKARETSEIASNKATLDTAEAGLQASLSARTITEARFISDRLALQKAAIAADERSQLDATGKILFSQQQAAKAAIGPEDRAKRQGDVQATEAELNKIRDDARAKNGVAERDAARALTTLNEQLAKTVEQANVAVLESQGRFVEAAQVQVAAEFRTAIDTALAQIASGNQAGFAALDAVLRRGEQIVDASRARQATAAHQNVVGTLQAQTRTIQAQQVEGTLSAADAEDQLVAAYKAAQVELEKVIVQQKEVVATQPANKEAVIELQNLNAEYVELGNTINRLHDPFRELKDAAASSTQSAFATFLEGATRLGTQSHAQINSLKAEIANANDELTTLLGRTNRSPSDNLRITALRSEIQQTTVALDNAKQSLTSWRSLFLDAAQSIVDALIKVSSQMLATALIERALGFLSGLGGVFGGGGGAGLGPPPETAASGGFGFGWAEGGMVSGPGGPTSDSVPAMLSAGEFVVRAAAVQALGPNFLETLNQAGITAPLQLRRGPRFFADGGIVRPVDNRAPAPSAHHLRVSLAPGLVLEELRTSEGHRAIVEVISDRSNAVNSALGR